MTKIEEEALGRANYEAIFGHLDYWDQLGARYRQAWVKAALAVLQRRKDQLVAEEEAILSEQRTDSNTKGPASP